MKYQTIFILTLLLITFTTRVYARTPVKDLKDITPECMQDILEGINLFYEFYDAVMNYDYATIIKLVSPLMDLYEKLKVDCVLEVTNISN